MDNPRTNSVRWKYEAAPLSKDLMQDGTYVPALVFEPTVEQFMKFPALIRQILQQKCDGKLPCHFGIFKVVMPAEISHRLDSYNPFENKFLGLQDTPIVTAYNVQTIRDKYPEHNLSLVANKKVKKRLTPRQFFKLGMYAIFLGFLGRHILMLLFSFLSHITAEEKECHKPISEEGSAEVDAKFWHDLQLDPAEPRFYAVDLDVSIFREQIRKENMKQEDVCINKVHLKMFQYIVLLSSFAILGMEPLQYPVQ